jgi:hypothetical protein
MSRAQLIDERIDVDAQQADEIEKPELFTEPVAEPESIQQTEPEQSSIPEKYRGKSLEEVVQMHQEVEKLVGKHSSEVGELRKVVDDYIQAQLDTKEAPVETQQNDDIDFFADPKAAVTRAIENHPRIREAERYSQEYKKQTALSQLQANHPDMQSILEDEKFAQWVKASKVRTKLFVQADQEYDFDSANELFSLWKERAAIAQQTVNVERQSRKQQVKSASTGSASGTANNSRKKRYRRVDLIKLMRTDPERYEALSPEIFQAYAEGRVI